MKLRYSIEYRSFIF